MNNIIAIIVLLFLVSSFVLFFSGIALCFHYIEGKEKKEEYREIKPYYASRFFRNYINSGNGLEMLVNNYDTNK